MWFKNLQVYRFTKPWSLNAEELEHALQANVFKPCSAQQPASYGWVPPLGQQQGREGQWVHAANGYLMVCARQQEKIMPAGVINERLAEKTREISDREQRKVSRREKLALKEEVIFDMLPHAFSRSQLHYAYIDTKDNLLVINSSSESRAELLVNALREAIGTLPVIPLAGKNMPVQAMTHWLQHGCPKGFTLGEECELADLQEKASRISCRGQNLLSGEIQSHLQGGMMATKLGLQWQERISFVMNDKLGIRKLKFSDVVQEEAANADDAIQQFDNDFAIMTLEIASFLRDLTKALGGTGE